MTVTSCAPFTEWRTRQGPHLLGAPDGAEVFVHWSNEVGGWWADPVRLRSEPAYAAGWRYIGLPIPAAEATAMIRARDKIAAQLQSALKANAALRAEITRLTLAAALPPAA